MPTDPLNLAHLAGLLEKATKGPWFSNGYSGVFTADPAIRDAFDALEVPPEPMADEARKAFRDTYYEVDTTVCHVPPQYGDTATGRHAWDNELIAALRNAAPELLRLAGEHAARTELVVLLAKAMHKATEEMRDIRNHIRIGSTESTEFMLENTANSATAALEQP